MSIICGGYQRTISVLLIIIIIIITSTNNKISPRARAIYYLCLCRQVKLALLSAQRCMIALGDIARYKELTNETTNYGKARG